MGTGIDALFRAVDLAPGDNVVIVTDTGCDPDVGQLLFDGALGRGIDASWSTIQARSVHGEELPPPVVSAVQSSHLSILATSVSASYAPGVTQAIKQGVRILSMPGVGVDMLEEGAMTADYAWVQRLTERWGERFARGRTVRVTTERGTDLAVDIGGWSRAPLLDCGRFPRDRGCMGNLPAGEAAISPIEGSAHGRVVADLTLSTTRGPLATPVTIEIEEGKITRITGGEEAAVLERSLSEHGDSALVVAEVAIGTNPAARHVGIVIEDEKALGTAHIGFGHAIGLGGTNISGIHVDAIFGNATFLIDDVPLTVGGHVADDGLKREPLESFPGSWLRFEPGPQDVRVTDGLVSASWRDLHGTQYWAQVGDDEASRAAQEVVARGRHEVQPGSREARLCELLAVYGVLTPVD